MYMHMESVNYLDPQCLESGQLPVEELLRDSVYYPACAFDGGIIRLFNTRLREEGVTSFVYCDFYADEEKLVEDVRKHMRGYHVLADRTVMESEFVKGTRVDFPFDMSLNECRKYERIMDGCVPFCHWFIFERDADFGPEHGPERFSLLYVCGESVATYIGLYNAYGVAPKALALVQCDGFSGNWTHFRSADGPLRVVMAQNEGGMPKYVINGGIGSADGYDNLGWSDYEEVDAVQPYYRSVWNECVVHDGGLVIYKRK